MTKEFDRMIAEMPRLFLKLRKAQLLSRDGLHGIPQRGVYVLYEDGKPIYVGRSNRLKHPGKEASIPNENSYDPN